LLLGKSKDIKDMKELFKKGDEELKKISVLIRLSQSSKKPQRKKGFYDNFKFDAKYQDYIYDKREMLDNRKK